MQIWPAFAHAPIAACSAAHSGSTPASTIIASLPPSSSSALPSRSTHASITSRPGLHRARVDDEVDARVRGERPAGARVAVDELQHVAEVEELDEARAGERRLLRRLVDDGVARHERGGDLPAGDRDRVVPGHEQRDDAARLVDHQVGRVPAALQRAPAVQRAELGVLLDRADAGLDAAERVGERLAALAGRRARRAPRRARAAGGRRPSAPRRARRAPCAPTRAGRRGRRARRASTASGEPAGMRPTSSPVAGSWTSSARHGARVRGQVQDRDHRECLPDAPACAQRHGVPSRRVVCWPMREI